MSLADYTALARELQARCRHMSKVKGVQKLERMIGTEIKFFQSLSRKDEATQTAQLQSSNLSHFAAIVHAATHLPSVTRVLMPVTSPDRQHSLVVDVVADLGRSWFKVIARKGQALHLVWAGQGQYGERDMVQQLAEYTEVAEHHPINFKIPEVHATFYNTITEPMAAVLRKEGVMVWGQEVPVDPNISHKLMALDDDDDEEDSDDGYEENECDDVSDDSADLVCDGLTEDRDSGVDVASDPVFDGPTEDRGSRVDLVCDSSPVINDCEKRVKTAEDTYATSRSPFKHSVQHNTELLTLSNDLDACDLETDSVQEVEDKEPERAREEPSSTRWKLTSRSEQCLSKILASFPDFSSLTAQCASPGICPEVTRERVNLDITTLITLVSSVCHGACNFRFQDKVLDQQALEERRHPSLPDLMAFLENKDWVVCRTAWSEFDSIVQLLGGPKEKARAEELAKKVISVDDEPSARASNLKPKGKVKERSKMVFGTGDQLEAVTVTANSGFIRAAESQTTRESDQSAKRQ